MKVLQNQKTKLYAFATDDGKLLTGFKYSSVDFPNQFGLRRVEKKHLEPWAKRNWRTNIEQGFVNSEGKEIVPLHFYYEGETKICYDKYGHCEVRLGDETGLYSTTGSVFKPKLFTGAIGTPTNGTYPFYEDYSKIGLYSSTTGEKVDAIYSDMSVFNKFGLALVEIQEEDNSWRGSLIQKKYGIINLYGKELLPCEYDKIIGFPPLIGAEDHKYDSEETLAEIRTKADNFYKGLVLIQNHRGWAVINLNSPSIKLDFETYQYIGDFDGQYLPLYKKGSGWGVVDYNCKVVVPFEHRSDYAALQAIQPSEGEIEPITTVIDKPFSIKKVRK